MHSRINCLKQTWWNQRLDQNQEIHKQQKRKKEQQHINNNKLECEHSSTIGDNYTCDDHDSGSIGRWNFPNNTNKLCKKVLGSEIFQIILTSYVRK